MSFYSGNVYLNGTGEATVCLPMDAVNMSNAVIVVSPYYNDYDKRVPLVAATKPLGGMFKITEVNHTPCEVAWMVTTMD